MPDNFSPELDVLREFIDNNNLRVNHSNIHLKSKCNFRTGRRNTNVYSDVIISFNNYNRECIVIIFKDFDVNFYPTVFLTPYQNIDIDEDALIIKGFFQNKRLGRYKVSIFPINKN
ncbi:hypothetical protein [Flavobacterium adhaerens]|uniref:hypothetical protein n=1 Tax=Flavobacterium adhaerens TaxID=3149043 RepID=UPI0032B6155E